MLMNVVIFCFSSSCVSSPAARQTADVPANCEKVVVVFNFSDMEVLELRFIKLIMKFQRKWRKALVFLTTFCVKLKLLNENWPE